MKTNMKIIEMKRVIREYEHHDALVEQTFDKVINNIKHCLSIERNFDQIVITISKEKFNDEI